MSRQNFGDYILGLDLGSNSVGWALAFQTQIEGEFELGELGSHIFEEAGADDVRKGERKLKNQERRLHRQQRKNLRRKAARQRNLYDLLARLDLMPADPQGRTDFLCQHKADGKEVHPIALRAKGVTDRLTPTEFARVLCHLNRRRGYLSTRDLMSQGIPKEYLLSAIEKADDDPEAEASANDEQKDRRKTLIEIAATFDELTARKLKTYGQLLDQLQKEGVSTRHYAQEKAGVFKKHPNLRVLPFRPNRQMLEHEYNLLWSAQAAHYPELLTDSLREEIRSIIFDQRGLQSAEDLRKRCPFHPSKKCAPKASNAFQKYMATQSLVQLKVLDTGTKEKRSLAPDEIAELLPILMAGQDLSYDAIELKFKGRFKIVATANFRNSSRGRVRGNRTEIAFRELLGEDYDGYTEAFKEKLLHISVSVPMGKTRYEMFKDQGFAEPTAAKLALINLPEGYAEYCTKILKELQDLMANGLQQKVALDTIRNRFQENREKFKEEDNSVQMGQAVDLLKLPADFDLRNPIVERTLRRTVWVVNQIIHRYGKPIAIHVEMPRELSAPAKKKQEIFRKQQEARKEREIAKQMLAGAGVAVNETNIQKYRLAQECNWTLPYETGSSKPCFETKDLEDLEIDHVVPRSHCWDNTWQNLLLTTRSFNASHKGNKTPYEAFKNDPPAWDRFETFVRKSKMSPYKKKWVLSKERPEAGFLNSQLASTGYIAKEARKLLSTLGCPVIVSKGRMTAELRRMWKLNGVVPRWVDKPNESYAIEDKPRDDHRHHAIDALVVALTSRSLGLRITKYFKDEKKANERPDLTLLCPIKDLRSKLEARLGDIAVTYRPNRRPKGAMNEATALSPSELAGTYRGHPDARQVVEGKLVRFDGAGKAAQVYRLGNNHHLTFYFKPGAKPAYEVRVVPMIEAYRRKVKGEDIFAPDPELLAQGFQVGISLCKGDIVEWVEDGKTTIYRVSAFSVSATGALDLILRVPELAVADVSLRNKEVNGIIGFRRVKSAKSLEKVRRRVVVDVLANVIVAEKNKA